MCYNVLINYITKKGRKMYTIEQVAKLAKKHNLHNGEVKWPDDDLENLYNFLNEGIKLEQNHQQELQKTP